MGLPAQIRPDARVLVLGSMPGAASLRQTQYYAHPRNRFWPLMAALCGLPIDAPYDVRLAALHQAGVGLWDVIGQCERRGSLDADIVRGSERFNDLATMMATLPQLRLVACNGALAHAAFQRFVAPSLAVPSRVALQSLPSTSPANAAWSLPRLIEAWRGVAVALA